MSVEFAPAAGADLQDVLDYISLDNPGRADSFVDEIIDYCLTFDDFPQAGHARNDLETGLRIRPYRNYLILYREIPAGVRIERILHARRGA